MSAAGGSWPAIGYEELEWETSTALPASRQARRRARGPYRAAVAPDIAGQTLELSGSTVALVEDAATEVARFDTDLGQEIAPFASVLLRSESAASSRIENLTASARAIAEAELQGHGRQNAALIVANQRAMRAAISLAHRIDADTILAMHAALLGGTAPEHAGRWREEPVWIGGGHLSPHGATYVAPRHTSVPGAIADLIVFIDRDDLPVLAHAAVAHAQFETIHPFTDGNGRTGRALVHAHLRNKGLTRNLTVPVSAGLLTDTDAYFAALTSYRAGDPTPIVERFADAALLAVANGRHLVSDLREVRAGWAERLRVRPHASAWRIVELVLRQPVVNASVVATELGIAPQNTYRSLAALVDAEILVEFTDKKRNRMWRSPEVLEALDAFAARAGRRVRATR